MKYRIERLGEETAYKGFLQLSRYRLRHSLFAGGMSRELVRERVEWLRSVAVLPYDPVLDKVVLIEQFRVGPLELDEGAWLLEIIGGIWDPGLDAPQVAYKEAREEAGCELLDLAPIGDIWPSPGTSTERVMLYCGRVDATMAGGLHGLEHEGEDIRVLPMDFSAAMGLLERGCICAATAVMGLQWLALHRKELRSRWV